MGVLVVLIEVLGVVEKSILRFEVGEGYICCAGC